MVTILEYPRLRGFMSDRDGSLNSNFSVYRVLKKLISAKFLYWLRFGVKGRWGLTIIPFGNYFTPAKIQPQLKLFYGPSLMNFPPQWSGIRASRSDRIIREFFNAIETKSTSLNSVW